MKEKPLCLFNSLTKKVEKFEPRNQGKAGIYVCGATVQGNAHIGHMRSAVAFDVLRRWLEKAGYDVTFIRNVTDIDDKILRNAKACGEEWWSLAYRFEREFTHCYSLLNVLPPTYEPRATGQIPEMVKLVKVLLEKGYAYSPSGFPGNVYFDVEKWKDYGSLTRQQGMADSGEEQGEGKRHPRDFALWKSPKPEDPSSASWEAPFGKGRPGWHLECSAMSHRFLEGMFDIHGGGLDLRFPHHENEMAQSLAAGYQTARYWIHSAWVTQKGEKMSKSLGNGLGVEGLCKKFSPWSLRYALSCVHYRSMLEWDDSCGMKGLEAEEKFFRFKEEAEEFLGEAFCDFRPLSRDLLPDGFVSAMNLDLNVSLAFSAIFELLHKANSAMAAREDKEGVRKMALQIFSMLSVLGLSPLDPAWKPQKKEDDAPLERIVRSLIKEREEARRGRDFEKADKIRKLLKESGIALEDGEKTSWRKISNMKGGWDKLKA